MAVKIFDFAVVGGGIVGLATARELLKQGLGKGLSVVVVEKEQDVAMHQTGHNSGVIHAGMYYQPGSMKARLCVEGSRLMYQFAEEHGIPHRRAGKLIVATTDDEMSSLEAIYKRGLVNGVPDIRLIDRAELREFEPLVEGKAAIWSPATGIINYADVARSIASGIASEAGGRGRVQRGFEVVGLDRRRSDGTLALQSKHGQTVLCRNVITACGLHADRVAVALGAPRWPRIVPFRGSYLQMRPEHQSICRHNIYPVPNPKFPFLGVHLTPTIDGRVILGPNAVLATAREGYSYRDANLADVLDFATNPGLLRMSIKHFAHGLGEFYRDLVPAAFVTAVQRYVPSVQVEQTETGPAGVRAMAINPDGSMIDDFVFQKSENVLHVRNAPSPAATSSLAIAKAIVEQVEF